MLFITSSVVRKFYPSTVVSQWKFLSAASKNYSSSTGYSEEEIEHFRKVFRTVPSYRESISSKDFPLFLQLVNYIKPPATYQQYVEYGDKALGGRYEINQTMKYFRVQHEPKLLISECLINFDRNNDGYVTKEEFEYCMESIRIHDPRIRNISYENFLKEADTNKDGKISIDECNEWLRKYLNV